MFTEAFLDELKKQATVYRPVKPDTTKGRVPRWIKRLHGRDPGNPIKQIEEIKQT